MEINQVDHYKFSLLKIRHILVERFLFGIFIISIFGGPMSALRAESTGWQYIYTIHLAFTVLLTLVYLFRNRIPFFIKSFIVVLTGFIIGVIGMFNFGILSVGMWWLIMNCLLINTLYSFRACIIAFFLSSILIFISGYSFINGTLILSIDANEYIKTPSSWIVMYIGAIAYPLVFFNTINSIQIESINIFNKLKSQKKRINSMSNNDKLINTMDNDELINILQSKINKADKSNHRFALFLIEFDGVNLIKDLLGSKANKQVLKKIANRLTLILSSNDIAMRISENQYFMVLEDIDTVNDMDKISFEISKALDKPIKYKRKKIDLSLRIGIGIYPDDADSASSLKNLTSQALQSIHKNNNDKYAFINTIERID